MPQLLKHRYKILRVLSEAGGFGQTFLAEVTDTPSRRRCVIKKLRRMADPESFKFAQERFQREAAILERLGEASDQIPRLYACFVEGQDFYLVQELIEGPTLRQLVQRQGVLSQQAAGELLVELLSVLAYVHEHDVIHRDVKPDNVIVRQRDNRPVLIDFGIVKEVLREGGEGLPTHTAMVGTPGYLPLEQAAGRPVFASDLYSLGATAIFLLTGKNPRRMTDPVTGRIHWRALAPEVGSEFAAVLDRSTEPDVRERFQTTAQMLEELHKALGAREHPDASQTPAAVEEETAVRPPVVQQTAPAHGRTGLALSLGVAATALGLLAVIGSAAVLTRMDAPSRAEQSVAQADSPLKRPEGLVEKPREGSTDRMNTAAATRTRTKSQPPAPAPLTPAPAGGLERSLEAAQAPGRFPEASLRLLTESDLAGRSPWELRIMRNEIFARHGYIFKTPEVRRYFARQQWYSPRHDDISGFLSQTEVQNAKRIKGTE